jgi:hypothetical protein
MSSPEGVCKGAVEDDVLRRLCIGVTELAGRISYHRFLQRVHFSLDPVPAEQPAEEPDPRWRRAVPDKLRRAIFSSVLRMQQLVESGRLQPPARQHISAG